MTRTQAVNTSVRELVLTSFRSYGSLLMHLDHRSVVLAGPNGAGKTNLLEAVSLLAPGRGLRRAELKDLIHGQVPGTGDDQIPPKTPKTMWAVSALLDNGGEQIRVGTGIEEIQTGYRRIVRINGEAARGPNILGQYVRAVWLTPAMDRLFVEGAGVRRRFLDRLVLSMDPDHAPRVAAYERAMRDRQRLLKEETNDADWLSALEATMVEKGVAIAAARLDLVSRLRATFDTAPDYGFPRVDVALDGKLETALVAQPAVDVEGHFGTALAASRSQDARAGRALHGPHRCDLAVHHSATGKPAQTCSTGEQKALLIAIVLAHTRALKAQDMAKTPILLLDEVVAHLDEKRRAALFDEISELECQAWLTGTDRALFASFGDRAQHFTVADGRVFSVHA